MDGLGRASGAPVVITLAGKDYMMEALTLKDFGTIEQHMLASRPNMLKVVADASKDLPPEMAKVLIERAYEDMKKGNAIPAAEVAEWVDSFEGMVFTIWLSLHKNDPEITQEDIMEKMQTMTEMEVDNLKDRRDVASGLDEVGNSTGPETTAGQPETEKESLSDDSRGEGSTETSPKVVISAPEKSVS